LAEGGGAGAQEAERGASHTSTLGQQILPSLLALPLSKLIAKYLYLLALYQYLALELISLFL
jgi:hypothetical protein